jgi:hypothetical protein
MAFVVYDANVLYGNTLRDLLIRLPWWGGRRPNGPTGFSTRCNATCLPTVPTSEEKFGKLRLLMNSAVRDSLIEGLKLPDPDDRHVLAAAIKAGAQIIVTSNLKDFPAEDLAPWGIEAKSPDDFVLDQIDHDGRVVWACVQQIADSRTNPPETVNDVLDALESAGLVESVAALRAG